MSYAVHRRTDLSQELELLRFLAQPAVEVAHAVAKKHEDPAARMVALSLVAPDLQEKVKNIASVAAVEHRRQESSSWTAERVMEVFREILNNLLASNQPEAAAVVERIQNKYLTGDGHLVPGPATQAITLMQAMDEVTLGAYNGTPYPGVETTQAVLETAVIVHNN